MPCLAPHLDAELDEADIVRGQPPSIFHSFDNKNKNPVIKRQDSSGYFSNVYNKIE